MNKTELIEKVALCAGLTRPQARRAIDCYHEAITGALQAREQVSLVGFGSFSVTSRSARKGRNLQSGKEILIPAKKFVKFKPGAGLTKVV